MRSTLLTFSGVASNFAGVPLAFAVPGNARPHRPRHVLLRDWFGFNLYGTGFNLLSFFGLTITYMYFQIPLMVLILTPALDGMKKEWREAAEILGASNRQYWTMVALPILWPSLLGTTLLLFANAFGAIATAYALTGSSLNIVPILLYAQIRGDVLHNPNLGYAIALGMIVITGVSNVLYLMAAHARRTVAEMKAQRLGAWIAILLGASYFIIPLLGTIEFSLRMRRGEYSFDAYRSVFSDIQFRETFGYSMLMALLTIVFGMLLVVPTAYWVRLRLPQMRPIVEFVTLLPLVIPAIVIVFGYLRIYNSSSVLPLTGSTTGTNLLLVCSYMTLSLPYMYRAVDTAMRAIDVRTLTEAAESLGASWTTIMFRCIFPNVMSGVLSGAFITLRDRHGRIHHGSASQPAGLRAVPAARRRQQGL